jgi:hypothetical protein
MNRDSAAVTISALRLAVGVGSYATPGLAGRAFGLDVDGNPQAPYLARLFGVRDVALAGGTLTTGGEARRTWLRMGLLCDAADAAAAVLAARAGYVSKGTAAMLAAPAVAAVAIGMVALGNGAAEQT